jgi:hypothetical protein
MHQRQHGSCLQCTLIWPKHWHLKHCQPIFGSTEGSWRATVMSSEGILAAKCLIMALTSLSLPRRVERYSLRVGHTENISSCSWFVAVWCSCCARPHKNIASNTSLIVVYISVAAVTWFLLSHCLAMSVCLGHYSLAIDVSAKLFPSNGHLCWLHNSGFQQTYHNINRGTNTYNN